MSFCLVGITLMLYCTDLRESLFSYGMPFIEHTYAHHVVRLDHRHNFSPYNVLLYLTSAPKPPTSGALYDEFSYASVAFLPQLFLSGVLLPLAFAKWDLPTTLFAQTFAFVTFNKVCTSQVSPHLSSCSIYLLLTMT